MYFLNISFSDLCTYPSWYLPLKTSDWTWGYLDLIKGGLWLLVWSDQGTGSPIELFWTANKVQEIIWRSDKNGCTWIGQKSANKLEIWRCTVTSWKREGEQISRALVGFLVNLASFANRKDQFLLFKHQAYGHEIMVCLLLAFIWIVFATVQQLWVVEMFSEQKIIYVEHKSWNGPSLLVLFALFRQYDDSSWIKQKGKYKVLH